MFALGPPTSWITPLNSFIRAIRSASRTIESAVRDWTALPWWRGDGAERAVAEAAPVGRDREPDRLERRHGLRVRRVLPPGVRELVDPVELGRQERRRGRLLDHHGLRVGLRDRPGRARVLLGREEGVGRGERGRVRGDLAVGRERHDPLAVHGPPLLRRALPHRSRGRPGSRGRPRPRPAAPRSRPPAARPGRRRGGRPARPRGPRRGPSPTSSRSGRSAGARPRSRRARPGPRERARGRGRRRRARPGRAGAERRRASTRPWPAAAGSGCTGSPSSRPRPPRPRRRGAGCPSARRSSRSGPGWAQTPTVYPASQSTRPITAVPNAQGRVVHVGVPRDEEHVDPVEPEAVELAPAHREERGLVSSCHGIR